ncbi:Alpha/beta hydrolase family-domain-containing protein, partial [Lyophyllum atratum]
MECSSRSTSHILLHSRPRLNTRCFLGDQQKKKTMIDHRSSHRPLRPHLCRYNSCTSPAFNLPPATLHCSSRSSTSTVRIMESKTFIIRDPPGGSHLHVSSKRYRFVDRPTSKPGIILILIHGVGFNKEIWEPFLEDLGALQRSTGHAIVKEAWAIDSPNNGEAAVLNDKVLFHTPTDPNDDYTRSALRLLVSGHIETIPGDRLVVIGHSVGATAAVWMSYLYHSEHRKLVDLCIMLEPPGEVLGKTPIKNQNSASFLDATVTRRDIWASKEQALSWLGGRRPWKVWDKRALKAYVDYAICPLPTSGYPDRMEGVTLACNRLHECFAYIDLPELNKVARKIPLLRQVVPIHVFVGE